MNKTTKTTLALGGMLSLALLTGCTLTAKKTATQTPAQQSATPAAFSLQNLGEVSAETKAALHKTLPVRYITRSGKVDTRPVKLYIPAGAGATTPLIYVPHYEIAENATELTDYLKAGWAVASPTEFKNEYNATLTTDDLVFNNAALYTLRNLEGIDKNRIGVVGGSAGGYMTLMLDALQMGTTVSVAASPIANAYFNFNKYFREVQRVTGANMTPADQLEFVKSFSNPATFMEAVYKLPLGFASLVGPAFASKTELPAENDTARWEAISPTALARTFSSPLVINHNTSDILVPLGQITNQHLYAEMGKTMPSGFTTQMGKDYPGVLSRTLEEQLDPKTTKVNYTEIRGKQGAVTMPFSKDAFVNINVYDDGAPERKGSHNAPDVNVTLSPMDYLKLQMGRGLAQTEVLSPEKVLLLLERYAGKSLQLPAHRGVDDTVYGSLAVYRKEVVQHLKTWVKNHSYAELETLAAAAVKTQDVGAQQVSQAAWTEIQKQLK